MKTKRAIFIAIGLALLTVAGLLFWKKVAIPCTSTVTISRLDSPSHVLHSDKSGTKRNEIAETDKLAINHYFLEGGKKTRTSYDPKDGLLIAITEGEGILHSAHFGEKGELIWFHEFPIKTGDYLSIPPKIAYQLEAPPEKPLSYLMFSLKGSQQREREFLRAEHPSSYPCDPRKHFIPNIPSSENPSAKSTQPEEHPLVVPDVLIIDSASNPKIDEPGEF